MPVVYTAQKIFTGTEWLINHAVVVEDGTIKSVVPATHILSSDDILSFGENYLVPTFIDIQIYGAYGKLLSAYPETDALVRLKDYCEKGGAAFCMPTVATNTYEVFYKAIDAIRAYWKSGGEGILGLHLEGPWINAAKRGAHIEALVHSPTLQQAAHLLNYGKDVIKIITLAPEVCSKEVLDLILSHNIIISAGHSNATYDEAKNGFANGITAVTHLFNAMSPLQHRQPGLVGAVMDDAKTRCSIIPDGYHVDYAAIRIAKQVMKQRLFVITDAVTDTSKGEYQHESAGDKYEAAGILSGSSLTMDKAIKNLVDHVGIEIGEAIRMCSLYPAQVLKMDNQLGKIAIGYSANITVLNPQLQTVSLLRK